MSTTVADVLTSLVRQAAEATGYGDSPVPLEPCVATKDAAHGDYQSNFAFRLGRALRTNPRVVAQSIVDAIPANAVVREVEVAGPGFVNFRLSETFLAEDLCRRAAEPRLGVPQIGAGRTMVVDYSSPNVAKRMHIAHLRSTVIGHAIDQLHRYLGWRVIADNHIGDWGTPFGKLIVAWNGWRDDDAFEADPLGELNRLYVSFKPRAEEDPSLEDAARAETAKLQSGDPDHLALWQRFVDISLAEFESVYARLGVSFDVIHGESFYRHELKALIEEFLQRGLATQDEDGSVVVHFDASEGKGLAKSPMLIQKRDGAALYATTDLATVRYRMRTWAPDRIVYVTDHRQSLHFRQFFAAARRWGFADVELEHVGFGILRFPGGSVASSRGGGIVRLVDVLDTAKARALEVVQTKSVGLSEVEQERVAEAIGVAAVRYFDLSQNPASAITFDWDRSLSLEGNTAPYLMYAYARCCSILRKAGDFERGGLVLSHPAERQLAVLAVRTPEVIIAAAEGFRPNLLCDHLYSLTQAFSRFWEQCRVLSDDNAPEVRQSRLTLTWAVSRALAEGMEIVGIEPVERM